MKYRNASKTQSTGPGRVNAQYYLLLFVPDIPLITLSAICVQIPCLVNFCIPYSAKHNALYITDV